MIIVMKGTAREEELQNVIQVIEELGYHAHVIRGTQRNVIGAVGDERGKARLQSLEAMEGVESEMQILETARAVKEAGAAILRGGAFKPRTSPYAFQGLGEEGLRLLAAAREETGLAIVTEVLKPEDVDLVAETADMIQIGARNVQNFALLKRVGEAGKPVLLKRGMATTIQEFLMAAEYILSEGNYDVVLCERGIRTFETATRYTLDLNAVPVIKKLSHLPVIVDPSHATGKWAMVAPLAKAAIAAGADGLLIEVHSNPECALCDGEESLKPAKFKELMKDLKKVAEAVGREL